MKSTLLFLGLVLQFSFSIAQNGTLVSQVYNSQKLNNKQLYTTVVYLDNPEYAETKEYKGDVKKVSLENFGSKEEIKSYDELSDVEKIQRKANQLALEKEKLEKAREIIEKRRWLEKNKIKETEVVVDEFTVESKKKYNVDNVTDYNDFNDIVEDSQLTTLRRLHDANKGKKINNIITKQIEILNKQNEIIKNELIGTLNPIAYEPQEKSVKDLRKNNAELKIFFPVSGMKSDYLSAQEKQILYDLIELNYSLKTKLSEMLRMSLDKDFNESMFAEFFYSSEALINFTS